MRSQSRERGSKFTVYVTAAQCGLGIIAPEEEIMQVWDDCGVGGVDAGDGGDVEGFGV